MKSNHIILLTETKMKSSDITSDFFKLENFDVMRKERLFKGGGGVAILVKEGIFSRDISEELCLDTESIACLIGYGSRKLLVACMYRAPDSLVEYSDKINLNIQKICNFKSDQLIICGDFNFPEIDWINHLVTAGSAERENVASRFYEICQDFFLYQHVTEFTRKRGSDEPSTLDLIFSKNEFEIDEIVYKVPIGKSDHQVLVFDFSLEGTCEFEEHTPPRKNYFKGKYKEINKILANFEWFRLLLNDVHGKWSIFMQVYNSTTTKGYVDEKKTPLGNNTNKKWMTSQTKKALDAKSDKWNSYRSNKTPENYDIYVRYRNDAVSIVRNAKKDFEMKLASEIEKGDCQGFYAYLRSQTTIKEGVSRVCKPDGSLTESLKDTSDTFNKVFQSVFVREGDEPVPNIVCRSRGAFLEDFDFTVDDVYKLILSLKENSSPGPDGVHPKYLIECADNLARPLFYLFRDSLDSGVVPEIWKLAHVTPIYKKRS